MLRSMSFGLNPVAVRPRFIAVSAIPGSRSDEPLRYGWEARDTAYEYSFRDGPCAVFLSQRFARRRSMARPMR
jgi:hypothetical protein